MKKVRIKEHAWIAKMAAKKLGYRQIAIVVGNTIYLHHTSAKHFINSKRWLLHELKHVEQYEEHGFVVFLFKYLIGYIGRGYYYNKYEAEARAAEKDERLLYKYEVLTNIR